MNNEKNRRDAIRYPYWPFAILTVFTLLQTSAVLAEPSGTSSATLALQAAAEANNWHVRELGFRDFCQSSAGKSVCGSQLMKPAASEFVQSMLIFMLNREEREIASGDSITEAQTNYFADLVQAVGNIQSPQAISVLMTRTVIESGGVATSGLARLGNEAAKSVLKDLDTARYSADKKDSLYLTALMVVLDKLARNKASLSKETASLLRIHFLEISYDSDRHLREAAMRGLANFNDSESRTRIYEMSRDDPWESQPGNFPLRAEAANALKPTQN